MEVLYATFPYLQNGKVAVRLQRTTRILYASTISATSFLYVSDNLLCNSTDTGA